VAVAHDPNVKPAKDKSSERIDGIVTLIMAIGRAIVTREEVRDTADSRMGVSRGRGEAPLVRPMTPAKSRSHLLP
jgi:hypothetical protein